MCCDVIACLQRGGDLVQLCLDLSGVHRGQASVGRLLGQLLQFGGPIARSLLGVLLYLGGVLPHPLAKSLYLCPPVRLPNAAIPSWKSKMALREPDLARLHRRNSRLV